MAKSTEHLSTSLWNLCHGKAQTGFSLSYSLLSQAQRIDLLEILEILEDRNGQGSRLITSKVPINQWCDVIGDPTLADAILDRFVHNAHRLNLTGDSLRRAKAKKAYDANPSSWISSQLVSLQTAHDHVESAPTIACNEHPRSVECAASGQNHMH